MKPSDAYLSADPIDPERCRGVAADGESGASVEFVGWVRRYEGAAAIECLEYEAYAPMAERVIHGLIEEAARRWPLRKIFVRHRVGRVPVGEAAVIIGVSAAHRQEAFAACQFLIDSIKRDAPIWKRAMDSQGRRLEPACACDGQPSGV
jgi:molybdopterin synthase catalytic subunit